MTETENSLWAYFFEKTNKRDFRIPFVFFVNVHGISISDEKTFSIIIDNKLCCDRMELKQRRWKRRKT